MSSKHILVTANESWNLVNFRIGLLQSLIADGFTIVAAAPYDARAVARLRQIGCIWEAIPMDAAGLRPWRDGKTFLAYCKLIRRYKPAAILSWTIKANLYAAWAAGLAGVVVIPNISGLGTAFMRRSMLQRIARSMYRQTCKRAATVFFQNEDDRAMFVDDGIVPSHKAVVLPGSGVNTRYFSPTSDDRPSPGHFLMISRVIADKGVREFVEAARSAQKLNPHLRFTLLGQSNVRNRSAIKDEELQLWVDEGVIDHKPPVADVRPWISSADFVVLPSYREGMSRVLLEASAMARPSITSDVPGCRDVVREGENGYLCAPRDAGSLFEAIRKAAVISDQEWTRMAQAARRTAVERFSEDVVVAAYRDALRRSGVEL